MYLYFQHTPFPWTAGLVQKLLRSRGKGLGFCDFKDASPRSEVQTKSEKTHQKWHYCWWLKSLHQVRLVDLVVYLIIFRGFHMPVTVGQPFFLVQRCLFTTTCFSHFGTNRSSHSVSRNFHTTWWFFAYQTSKKSPKSDIYLKESQCQQDPWHSMNSWLVDDWIPRLMTGSLWLISSTLYRWIARPGGFSPVFHLKNMRVRQIGSSFRPGAGVKIPKNMNETTTGMSMEVSN